MFTSTAAALPYGLPSKAVFPKVDLLGGYTNLVETDRTSIRATFMGSCVTRAAEFLHTGIF